MKNLETIRKTITAESAKAAMRKRHGLPDDAAIEIKVMPMEMVSSDGHRFKARITTDSLDRDGEVMQPLGMDSSEFDKSGAIFWNHDYDKPVAKPAGKMVRTKGYVDCEAEFAKRPDDYQGDFFPDFARAMVQQGIVKGVSVGFIPIEARSPSKKDVETWGDDVRRVHSKFRLLEWSIAPVQCNPDAVIQMAISKGIINEKGELQPKTEDSEGFLGVNEAREAVDYPPLDAENEAKTPENGTCSACEKDHLKAEMTEKDGVFTCSACSEAAKSAETVATFGAATESLVDLMAAEPVKRVNHALEPADEPEIVVKRVHRIIAADNSERKARTVKHITRTIRKMRGRVHQD